MKNKTNNRIWIKAERGLSFDDIREAIPYINLKDNTRDTQNNITKITLLRNLYKQEKIAEIFFDEERGRFLFDEKFNRELCTELGKLYAFYTLTLSHMTSLNPSTTFEHMLLALTEDIITFMEHNTKETNN